MSRFTSGSTTTLVHKHDGHKEGFLNCLAVRHGWTRTFSISPDELPHLDYTQLEKVLELKTLRLRPYMVRVYVEEPAGSGIFSKIRFWKDDGSLQSVLVKEYFERRCGDGGIITFELRDGRDRTDDDDDGTESAFASKTSLALAKLRRKASLRRDTSTVSSPLPTPGPEKTRMSGFFDFFRLPRNIRPQPPLSHEVPMVGGGDDEDEDEDLPPRTADPEEQALLQRRGWMPPLFRRVVGGSSATDPPATSSSSVKRRSKGKGRADPSGDVEPGEEDAHPFSEEEWEVQDTVPTDPLAQQSAKQRRPGIFARLNSNGDENGGGGAKKAKSKSKKKKDAAGAVVKAPKSSFQGAERVQRPEDAMPPPAPPKAGAEPTNPFDD